MQLSAPVPLTAEHDVAGFDCGDPSLNDWLRRRALPNQATGASRCYVVTDGQRVVGYHALAAGSVPLAEAPGRVRRNMPNPIPVMILARLAVDVAFHRQGIGDGLLKDALLRTVQAADLIGVRAVLVHALTVSAKRFYERAGFIASPLAPQTLFLPLEEVRKALAAKA